MGLCPYCGAELHITNFFVPGPKKKNLGIEVTPHKFVGETIHLAYKNYAKMYTCPNCDKILGFSEYKWDDD